jgi:hypothetical protein
VLAQVLTYPRQYPGRRVKDLALVATRVNTLHQFNAANGNPAATTKVFDDLETTARSVPTGIMSTPVVDYDKKLVYIVYGTQTAVDEKAEIDKPAFDSAHWLVAWDLQQQTIVRSTKIMGSFPKSDGSPEWFRSSYQWQHAALLLHNGSIYLGFGARACGGCEETFTYHGWLFRYDAENFTARVQHHAHGPRTRGVATVPASAGGGGVTADDVGNIVLTGNGSDNERKVATAIGWSALPTRPDPFRGLTAPTTHQYLQIAIGTTVPEGWRCRARIGFPAEVKREFFPASSARSMAQAPSAAPP